MEKLDRKQEQMSGPVRGLLQRCAEAVHEEYPEARIVLFGSQARGEATAQSDVDVLVLLNSAVSSQERSRIHDRLYEIALDHDVVISAIIKSTAQWEQPISRATPLYQAVQNGGILVA